MSYDFFPPGMCLLGVSLIGILIFLTYGVKFLQKQFRGREYAFSSQTRKI